MTEMKNDPFYEMISNNYVDLCVDYVILSYGGKYNGEITHKAAVIEMINILNKRQAEKYPHCDTLYVEEDIMQCRKTDIDLFFSEYEEEWEELSPQCKCKEIPKEISYWYAFSDPPYGNDYNLDDFHKINNILFPAQFRNDLEIYRWNDDFSNYFDAGKEWWGTGLWSIYDKWMHRFVIIGASTTD